jgi:hypothetical protein
MAMLVNPKPRKEKGYVTAYLNSDTIRDLDVFRGEVARSRIVQRALHQFLEMEKVKTMTMASGVTDKKE